MIGFWLSLVKGKETKLSKALYKKMLHDYNAGIYEHKWRRCIRDILVSVGRLDLFHKSVIDNPRSVKMSISRVLFDLHIQEWVQKLMSLQKVNFILVLSKISFFKTIYQSLIQNIIYPSSSLEPVTTNYPSRQVDWKMFH